MSLGVAGFSTTARAQEGQEIFETACASCHTPAGTERAPSVSLLRQLTPRAIVASLEDGVMRVEGADLTREQRIAVAEYLTRRRYEGGRVPESTFCTGLLLDRHGS